MLAQLEADKHKECLRERERERERGQRNRFLKYTQLFINAFTTQTNTYTYMLMCISMTNDTGRRF